MYPELELNKLTENLPENLRAGEHQVFAEGLGKNSRRASAWLFLISAITT
jgi:hypothetical protein